MNFLLVEPKVKAIAPNIALMKFARWCEINGHSYQYVRGIVRPDIIPDKILISCIFSYYSDRYEKTINYYKKKFPSTPFLVGGVFPTLYPKWFYDRWDKSFYSLEKELSVHCGLYPDLENVIPKYNVKIKSEDKNPYPRDKIVLYASRGCTNKCGYCAVPRLEGSMKSFRSIKSTLDLAKIEIPNASSVVLYDNNFTEHEFFDDIIDELVDHGLPVDIHGLHVDSFTDRHAKQFSRLKWAGQGKSGMPYLRFSFDKLKYANNIERALNLVKKYDVKAGFFCYMLFNYTDSPDDFWWRIQKAQEIVDRVGKSIFLFPQRYEPFKPNSQNPMMQGLKRNQYIGPKWSKEMVDGLVRLYTYIHGFVSVTPSHNLFQWIGRTKQEFFERIIECSKGNLPQKIEKTLEEEYPEGIIFE